MENLINLNFLVTISNDSVQNIIIPVDKKLLSSQSEYFNSLFLNNFKDSKNIEINLNFSENYKIEPKYLEILFRKFSKIFDEYLQNSDNIRIIIDNNFEENGFSYNFFFNDKSIPLHDIYMIIPICNYLIMDKILDQISIILDKYMDYIINLIHLDDFDLMSDNNDENIKTFDMFNFFELKFNKLTSLYKDELINESKKIKRNLVLNNFFSNLSKIFLTFHLTNKLDKLDYCLTLYKSSIENFDNYSNLNCKIPEIGLVEIHNDEFINCLSIEEYYNYIKLVSIIQPVEKKVNLTIYDDQLNFEYPSMETFEEKLIDSNLILNQQTLRTFNEFIELFNKITNNIFNNVCWDNMIITGDFIFELLNNLQKSISDSTDIEIFVYSNDEQIKKQKVKYLLDYFDQFKPIYIIKNSAIILLIKLINFDIKIICSEYDSPFQIIENFDLNYVQIYFDGKNIFCDSDALLAFKYQLALIKKKNIDKMKIYKTLEKGLFIKKEPDLKIDDLKILSKKMNIYSNKSKIIRNLMNILQINDLIFIIKSYYKCKNVSTDYNLSFEKINYSGNFETYFLDLEGKHEIISNFELIKNYEKNKINFYKLVENKKILKNFYILTDFCDFFLNKRNTKTHIIITLDDGTIQKLESFKNQLAKKIINKKKIINRGSKNNFNFKIFEQDENDEFLDDEDEENDKNDKNDIRLKVKITDKYRFKNLPKNFDLNNLDNEIYKIKILAKGIIFGKSNEYGVKFELKELEVKKILKLI